MHVPGIAVTGPVFLLGLVVFHVLERCAPVIATRTGPRRRGYVADFVALILDGPVLSGLTKLAAFQVVLLFPQSRLMWGWPWWAQFAVFLLVNDFLRYWLHRWYHESNLLWRIHRVHHTVVEMDAMSTFRVHLLEAVIKYGVIVLPFYIAGVNKWVVVTYTCIDILKGFWHHANLRTYIGRWNYIFNSAEMHWWHHSVEARGQRANYGSIFSIWDWLFRTAYWPRGIWPERIGVDGMERFPDHYPGQFASVRFDDAALIRRLESTSRGGGAPSKSPPAGASPSQAPAGRGELPAAAR